MTLALVIAGGVLAVLLVIAALAWFLGWSAQRWTRLLRASATDAGERTADGLAELWDFLRLGR
jgi:ferric-dicitrate binding protein FerR (iron transport regulator)